MCKIAIPLNLFFFSWGISAEEGGALWLYLVMANNDRKWAISNNYNGEENRVYERRKASASEKIEKNLQKGKNNISEFL